jgi:hypothetical protein
LVDTDLMQGARDAIASNTVEEILDVEPGKIPMAAMRVKGREMTPASEVEEEWIRVELCFDELLDLQSNLAPAL